MEEVSSRQREERRRQINPRSKIQESGRLPQFFKGCKLTVEG